MARRAWFLAAVCAAGCAAGCSNEEAAPFDLPALSTPYALFATAAVDRPLSPNAVQVIDLQGGVPELRPAFIAGGDIDALWAGLDPLDLPIGLTPEALTFVRGNERGTRALPTLYTPHVLRAPSDPELPDPLVPVDDISLTRSVREDREGRLSTMLSGVAISEPCRAPPEAWQVNTPIISPEAVIAARPMSDGTTVLGLAATSTAVIGVLARNGRDVQIIGVGFDWVQEGERATVLGLDGEDVIHPSGARVPSALSVDVEIAFGGTGSAWLYRQGQWRRDEGLDPLQPRAILGIREVTVDGVPSLCAFGLGQGPQRPANIWCRAAAGNEWSAIANFENRFGMTTLVELSDNSLLAVDFGGTVYRRPSGDSDWIISAEAVINVGCQPLCATIPRVASINGEAGAPDGFWVAGDKSQVLRLDVEGGQIDVSTPSGIDEVLFGDERRSATTPIDFVAAVRSPDGALWLATNNNVLLRRDPTGQFERICMPDAFEGVAVGALAVHDDGRLIMSGSPIFLAQTTWMMP